MSTDAAIDAVERAARETDEAGFAKALKALGRGYRLPQQIGVRRQSERRLVQVAKIIRAKSLLRDVAKSPVAEVGLGAVKNVHRPERAATKFVSELVFA